MLYSSLLGRLRSGGSWIEAISKITRAKRTGDVAQAIECLLCKLSPEFKPQSQQKQNKTAGK
jgi:hypothetical protein